ncbi:MAG: tetratricopeptide repeat protein [Fimbriimonas sp.]
MNLARLSTLLAAFLMAAVALPQAWIGAYENGLKAGKANRWEDARKSFQQAIAYRPEDQAAPTVLPGPVSEQRQWRNGAAYSPNFLGAYAAYRIAIATNDLGAKKKNYDVAAAEFETLLAKDQVSKEALFFLGAIYNATGNTAKRDATLARGNAPADWKIDTDLLSTDEKAIFNAVGNGPGRAGVPSATAAVPTGGPIVALQDKFALVIGNSESRLPDGKIPFAGDDAQRIRQALLDHAGYLPGNIDLAVNATAGTIRSGAKALADRVTEGSTVFIYFTGAGTNIGGKDYLAGVDAESGTDMSGMIAKLEIYNYFMAKGARVFAFFQAHRPIVGGRFFGQEVPLVGSISQSQATLPGETVSSVVRSGKVVGIYTDAVAAVLGEMSSNRVPILEFGWQVFYKVRRGDTGSVGGASRQTPTLPVLTNMASDARF